MPGPGLKVWNPKGLVEAASMDAHRSMPLSWQNTAISLIKAMLMWRYVFSSNFANSASRRPTVGTTVSTIWA
tara:strand:+ start:1709 stop:1924 length:216 start_codon:yes stop_codon:yes gene_type:complete